MRGTGVQFVLLYHREPHAGQLGFKDRDQPESAATRAAWAAELREEMGPDFVILCDTMRDRVRTWLGGLPHPAVIVSPEGRIEAKLPWAEPERITAALGQRVDRVPVATAGLAGGLEPRRRR